MIILHSAITFIQSSVIANNQNSDTDSEDENQRTQNAGVLSANQLLGPVVLEINTPSGRVIRGDVEELSNKNEKIGNCQSKVTKQRKTNNHHVKDWRRSDMPSNNNFTQKLEAPILDKTD